MVWVYYILHLTCEHVPSCLDFATCYGIRRNSFAILLNFCRLKLLFIKTKFLKLKQRLILKLLFFVSEKHIFYILNQRLFFRYLFKVKAMYFNMKCFKQDLGMSCVRLTNKNIEKIEFQKIWSERRIIMIYITC